MTRNSSATDKLYNIPDALHNFNTPEVDDECFELYKANYLFMKQSPMYVRLEQKYKNLKKKLREQSKMIELLNRQYFETVEKYAGLSVSAKHGEVIPNKVKDAENVFVPVKIKTEPVESLAKNIPVIDLTTLSYDDKPSSDNSQTSTFSISLIPNSDVLTLTNQIEHSIVEPEVEETNKDEVEVIKTTERRRSVSIEVDDTEEGEVVVEEIVVEEEVVEEEEVEEEEVVDEEDVVDEEVVEEEEEVEVVEEEVEEEEEEEVEEEEEEEVEVEVEVEEEEEVVEEEEEVEVEEVVEEEVEVVEEEEEVVEEEEVEVEVEDEEVVEEGEEEGEAVEEETEEEGVYETVIFNKKYYITNETDGDIYDMLEDGDIGEIVGKYINGVPML
jgi:hypothetical protein